MKEISLCVFNDFKCIGKDCKNNCCKNWEIDIDKKSLKYYKKISKSKRVYNADYLEKLKNGIDYKKGLFIMEKQGKESRCPFLNKDNLCDIYINSGKERLCKICTLHPRFNNYYKDRKEWGVGLCCPQAAKSLLLYDDKITFTVYDDGKKKKRLNDFEKRKLALRDEILSIVQDRKDAVKDRVKRALALLDIPIDTLCKIDFKNILLKTEALKDKWKDKLNNLKMDFSLCDKYSVYAEQLLVYFIFRHFACAIDGLDQKSRLLFCILSATAVLSLYDSGKDSIVDCAIEYSEEIEYSTGNLEIILDETDSYSVVKNV